MKNISFTLKENQEKILPLIWTQGSEEINISDFKDKWNIAKDQIKICKDCEFRYSCSDCRAYLEIPDDIYSKPLKCGYNPYTTEWEDWNQKSVSFSAIQYYGMLEEVPIQA